MFWEPEIDTSTVVLVEAPAVLSAEAGVLPKGVMDADRAGFRDIGDRERLRLFRADRAGAETLAAIVPLGLEGFDRLEAIHRLLSALHGRAIPPDTRLTSQQRLRMRHMLQAHDARRDGATQKEIARVIFRTGDLTRDEWQVHSTRYAVISLLRDARVLVGGGYRRLLRHRRKR